MDILQINGLKSKAYDLLKQMNGYLDRVESIKQQIFELEKKIDQAELENETTVE